MAGEDTVLTKKEGRAQSTTLEDNLHEYANVASAVSVGQVVYQASDADDKVALADADGAGTIPPIGVVVEVIDTTTCVVCHSGGIATGLSGLTRGTAYWLSTTAGAVVGTKPSTNAYLVGVALSATTMIVTCLPADLAAGGGTAVDDENNILAVQVFS